MMTPEKVHMLRCASSLGVAAYGKYTPHFSGLARLASGAFCGVIKQCHTGAGRYPFIKNTGFRIKYGMTKER
jgi:hypothetical protein